MVGAAALADWPPNPNLLRSGMEPFVGFSGADSKVKLRQYRKVTSVGDWPELWISHLGLSQIEGEYNWFYNEAGVPFVDFERCMVISVFQGEGWNSAGVRVVTITEEEDHILLRFDDQSYQTMGPDGGGQRVTPFGIFVLPRSKKPVVLEENVQGLIGKPPVWKERARL
jgi:hypothetical protein